MDEKETVGKERFLMGVHGNSELAAEGEGEREREGRLYFSGCLVMSYFLTVEYNLYMQGKVFIIGKFLVGYIICSINERLFLEVLKIPFLVQILHHFLRLPVILSVYSEMVTFFTLKRFIRNDQYSISSNNHMCTLINC